MDKVTEIGEQGLGSRGGLLEESLVTGTDLQPFTRRE